MQHIEINEPTCIKKTNRLKYEKQYNPSRYVQTLQMTHSQHKK